MKDGQYQLTGRPIVEEGKKTIPPSQDAELKIPRISPDFLILYLTSGSDRVLVLRVLHLSERRTKGHWNVLPLSPETLGSCRDVFNEEKDDFVMNIMFEMQSLSPAAAVFTRQVSKSGCSTT